MQKIIRVSNLILLVLLAIPLLVQAVYSLRWLIAHDEAPLLYEAFLMRSDGLMPYRDLFDFQMPGSYVAYFIIGGLSGFDAFRIRALDLALLVALLAVTFLAMRRFGKTSAVAAALIFGLKYLEGGPSLALQREYLLLIPIALAFWMNTQDNPTSRDYLLIGFFFGLAATIKPHAALGLVPMLIFGLVNKERRSKLILLLAAIGFATPLSLALAWLAWTGALTPFMDIIRNYLPLYAQINGQMEITPADTRLSFLLTQFIHLGGHAVWLLPAAIGVYLVPQENKKQAYLLASLALCYAVYPVFSGQFFEYHYLPFIYFIILLASLSLASNYQLPITNYAFLLLLLAVLINVRPSNAFIRQIEGKPIATSTNRADEIARYLKGRLQTGDTVQPLDWTGGTLLAMLETRARIATPYVFDFYFYHHVSTPYIQSLRADFMTKLQTARPRFIIEVVAIDKPWITGEDAAREFPELREFLNKSYSVTIDKKDYLIYERR
jgi:hypothetical protein